MQRNTLLKKQPKICAKTKVSERPESPFFDFLGSSIVGKSLFDVNSCACGAC